jgi:hypothetical protein
MSVFSLMFRSLLGRGRVDGIPALVVIKPDGTAVTLQGEPETRQCHHLPETRLPLSEGRVWCDSVFCCRECLCVLGWPIGAGPYVVS